MENQYKGDLKGFPKEVVERMFFLQEEHGNGCKHEPFNTNLN